MKIGVLAVQGDFAEHIAKMKSAGHTAFEIRQPKDIPVSIDGLILAGGESTAMKKLLHDLGLFDPIRELIISGLPVFGTCAGMILLAKRIEDEKENCFGTMDITVRRNAYGRQLGSFRCVDKFNGKNIEMPFIRAPYVTDTGSNTEILGIHEGRIISVRQDNQLAAAFHPELTGDDTVYDYFYSMIAGNSVR